MAYKTTNPYTGNVEKEFATISPDEIATAIDTAHEAFQEWSARPVEERTAVLAKAAQTLRDRTREYAQILTTEMGKTITEAEGEVILSADILQYYVDHAAELLEPRPLPVAEGEGEAVLLKQPQGVLFAVEPWNFPYYQLARVAAPQLSAGNVLLVKHASNVPQSALAFEALLSEAGAPKGVYTNLFASHDASEQIISDPRVRGVALTGSEEAGAVIAGLAGKYLKKSTMELGGADAFIVLEDADLPATAHQAAIGRNWNAGQVCCSSKRFIVVDSVYDEFLDLYRKEVAKLHPGDPMDEATTYAPMHDAASLKTLKDQVDRAVAAGAEVETLQLDAPLPEQGAFFQPQLLTNITPDNEPAREEFFGPVGQLYRAKDEEDAIRLANDSTFGLGGSVFTEDVERGRRVAARLDTGMVYINHPTWVKADIPFAGVKHSGYGHELIDLGFDEFLNIKVVDAVDVHAAF
jgi:succinate-semialdehyde dehydrogenase/glutarate-semialdehyde dehydrogenase